MSNSHVDPESGADPSIADLFRSLVQDTQRLVRDEIALARTEFAEKATIAARESMRVLVGAGLAIVGCVALSVAVMMGLAHALTPLTGRDAALWISPLAIGVVAGGVGSALAYRAIVRLRQESMALDKTADSLRQAGRLVKDRFAA